MTDPMDNPLDNPLVQQWLELLEKGDLPQQLSALVGVDEDDNDVGFCCLGVACNFLEIPGLKRAEGSTSLLSSKTEVPFKRLFGFTDSYDGAFRTEGAYLPPPAVTALGLRTSSGEFHEADGSRNTLAAMNDEGATFKEIAAIIRSRPKGLFNVDA